VFLGISTRQAIRRGSFDNVAQLIGAIRAFIAGLLASGSDEHGISPSSAPGS
jgi:hypothetical protein